MLTRPDLLAAFTVLNRGGIRHDYTTREALEAAADLYAAVLGDLARPELEAAVLAYLRAAPEPGQWSKPWPDPGRLLSLVPARRVAALDDGAARWKALLDVASGSEVYRGREPERYDADPTIDAMIREGLRAVTWQGHVGVFAIARCGEPRELEWMRKAFVKAYRDATQRCALEGGPRDVTLLDDHRARRKQIPGSSR